MRKKSISIIICTYNRCESLKDTLSSLAELKSNDQFNWEVIIVDNNSSDQTRSVVEEQQPAFNDRLRYIYESEQGLSCARNRGIKEAKGEIIVFTDDDVLVDENWLKYICEGYEQDDPDCLFGKILPKWQDCIAPNWLIENKKYLTNLAILDHGDKKEVVTTKDKHFFGANFSIKKDVFRNGFEFDEKFGIKGEKRMQGDDTELFYYLVSNKKKIIYEPKSLVWHVIPKERIRKSYFRKWNFTYGRSAAKLEQNVEFTRHFNVPRWHIRSFVELPFKWLKAIFLFKPLEAIQYEFRFFYTIGYIVGCLRSH